MTVPQPIPDKYTLGAAERWHHARLLSTTAPGAETILYTVPAACLPEGFIARKEARLKFCVLRSGSSGNCSYLEHGDTRLLIDAGGFSLRRLEAIIAEIPVAPQRLAGIVVTHLHADHINTGTLRFSKKFGVPVWIHEYNMKVIRDVFEHRFVNNAVFRTFAESPCVIGAITVRPFAVPHDAAGITCGFRFSSAGEGGAALAYAADIGTFTGDLLPHFINTTAVYLEANHDPDMLWSNPLRPAGNKKRVTGGNGHLSNEKCGEAVAAICAGSSRPPAVVIMGHLSRDNNTPDLALRTVRGVLERHGIALTLCSASRESRTPLFDLG